MKPGDARARVCAECDASCTRCLWMQQDVGPAAEPGKRFSPWSPAVNVLLLVALFVAVKLKLVFAAVGLAGLLGLAAWRAWA